MARTRIARGLKLLVLLSALGLAIAALSQCRMINDPVAGTELHALQSADARSECISSCAAVMEAARQAEEARHDAAMQACGEGNAAKECRKAEQDLHKQNQSQIQQDFKACKSACYNEGAGGAGR